MSARIDATFAALRDQGRTAVIPYVPCGDPFADATVDILLALAAGGADVIELGVPFSDPMADGPVIQKASERALSRGIGTLQVLQAVRGFRERDSKTPLVLMGYANPIEAYDLSHGAGSFVRDAAAAGGRALPQGQHQPPAGGFRRARHGSLRHDPLRHGRPWPRRWPGV